MLKAFHSEKFVCNFACNGTRLLTVAIGLALIGSLGYVGDARADDDQDSMPRKPHILSMDLVNTTQGTFWPPSTVVDKNGDYVLVGTTLEQRPGNPSVNPYPFQAVIVSKNTTPPLDGNGREDFSNPFGAPYEIVRQLDMSPGSVDLNMPLYTQSFGPYVGNFGGGGRSPKLGDSIYNLNALGGEGWEEPCPEVFPASSQRYTFTQDSRPLQNAIVPGFKGDQVAYDVDTGKEYVPRNKNGANCPANGCLGEGNLDMRRTKPITLGEYLNIKAKLKVELTHYSEEQKAYTSARFTVVAKDLFPNSIFQVVLARSSFMQGRPLFTMAHRASMPGLLVTDEHGRGRLVFEMENPFPDPAVDDAGERVIALGIVFKSDYMVAGMCNYRFAPGVDVHAVATTIGDGNPNDFDTFVTKKAMMH